MTLVSIQDFLYMFGCLRVLLGSGRKLHNTGYSLVNINLSETLKNNDSQFTKLPFNQELQHEK